ncbi:allergin-1 isoform X2 [Mesoplodon densirostris]|uniref:allergin-1 isoform X2 n=1 Tax=Mesoplodon densirostris TaxID=48708 RepID=UPI0028DC5358|nr:allergin-1 isoform X2 [Mesoplodon densirostris]
MWKKSFLMFLFSLSVQKAALDCERMRKTNEFPSPNLNSQTDAVMRGQNVSLSCFNQNKSLRITYFLFRGEKCLSVQNGPMTFNLTISEARDLGPYKCKAQVSNCSKYSCEFNFTFVDPVTAPVLNISAVQTKTDRYIMLRCISFNGSLPINYTFFEKNMAISPAISKNVREPAEFNLTKNNTGERKEYRCEAKNRLPDHAKYSQLITIPSTGKAMKDNTPRVYGNTPMEDGIYANICKNQADEKSVPGLEPRQCVSKARDGTEYSQEIHYATPMFQEVAPRDQETCNDCKTGYVYSELIF